MATSIYFIIVVCKLSKVRKSEKGTKENHKRIFLLMNVFLTQ